MSTLVKNNRTFPSYTSDPFTTLAREFFGLENVAKARNDAPKAGSPRFDLIEGRSSYTLRGDVPGMEEEHLEIKLHQGILSITGSYGEETLKDDASYIVRERRFGDFTRSLKVPKGANPEEIQAKLARGILSITIAKKEEEKARKIQIE